MAEEFLPTPGYVVDPRLPWDLERPREAEASFRAELRTRLDTPEGVGRTVELLTQLARAQAVQARIPDAHGSLAESARLLAKVEQPTPQLRQLLEMGRVLTLERMPSRARALFAQAFTLASEVRDDFLAIDAAQMMSLVESPKLQLEWLDKAMALASKSEEPASRKWMGVLLQSRGWFYFDMRQYDRALDCFTRAAELWESDGDRRKANGARYCMARTLRATKKFTEALAIQQSILADYTKSGRRDGLVYEELAECLHALKKAEDAHTYFALAHELLSQDQWLSDNRSARLNRLKNMAKSSRAES